MQIGRHFNLVEFTRSQTAARNGLDNTPPSQAIDNLRDLCQFVLDPLREALGRPIHISSGYRSPKVNQLAGGSPTSQHQRGEASDNEVEGLSPRALFDYIRASDLPIDQCILEFDEWVHISYSPHRQRGQFLIATHTPQGTHYQQVPRLPVTHAILHEFAPPSPQVASPSAVIAPPALIRQPAPSSQALALSHEDEAELGITVGWPHLPPPINWQAIAAPTPAPATTREISPQLIASGLRTIVTAGGGILLALGWITPEKYTKVLGVDYVSIAGLLLMAGSYIWSWYEKHQAAQTADKAIAQALVMEPVKADETLVTPADVKQVVALKDAAMKDAPGTPVERLIDERIRFIPKSANKERE